MKYIGTKMVEAVPAQYISDDRQGYVLAKDEKPKAWMHELLKNPEKKIREGYKVTYEDGYTSFSPKDVFEKAYLPLTVNQKLRTDAPSISQEMVDGFIDSWETTTMGGKNTVVRAVLVNGFEIVESSACVSAENYDERLGEQICLKKIKDKVWFLLGFLLQTAVHGVCGSLEASEAEDGKKEENGKSTFDCWQETEMEPFVRVMDFGEALSALKKGQQVARKGWNGKGQYIELAEGISYRAPAGKQVQRENKVVHEDIGSRAICFVGNRGRQMGWLASQADMLATDWYIV